MNFTDPAQWAIYAELTSVDTRVALLGYLAQTLACCGYLDQARSRCDEGVAEARATSHAPTLAHILFVTWCVGWSAHAEPSTLLPYVDELLALSADRELVFWHNAGMASRGWCLAMSGRGEEGIALLTGGLSYPTAPPTLDLFFSRFWLTPVEPLGSRGLRAHLAGAAHQAEATSVRWCQCETLRMRGILLTLTGDRLGAEASFRDAIALAQQQSAKFFELRAALDLARHWRAKGKHDDAQDLLAPIYGWFTEGFDTLDLKEAKALLDGLAP